MAKEGKANEIIMPAEKNRVEKYLKEIKQIRDNRQQYEKQALINIAFLYGKQHFEVDRIPNAGLDQRILWELKNIERKNKVKRTSNYILPLFRSLMSRLMMMKSTVSIEPTTTTDRDKAAAKVGGEVVEDFWQNCNKNNPILSQDYVGMMMSLRTMFSYILTTGLAHLKPHFNPKTRTKLVFRDGIAEGEVGEVEVKCLHLFDAFKDPMKRYFIEQSVMHVDEIHSQYGQRLEPENVGFSETEQRLINMLEGGQSNKFEDASRVFERYQVADDKNPDGTMTVFTPTKIIFEGPIPPEYKGKLPEYDFKYMDLGFTTQPQGMVEQLVNLQEDYNYTLSRLAGYKKWMAGKVMTPRNAELSAKWDDEIGQIIFYAAGNMPTYQNPPNPPSFLLEELIRIRKDMEDISGVHDTSLGRIPAQAKSGRAIENLTELDNSQLAPTLLFVEQQLGFFVDKVLDIMEQRYTEPRFLAITGDNLRADIRTVLAPHKFLGSGLIGNRRIKVSLGSSLPTSKEARQEFIMILEEKQYITKERARELLEFADTEGIYHNADEIGAKEDIQNMMNPAYEVVVEEWEDHTVRIKVVTDFMKTPHFYELPIEIREKFIQYRKAHQEYLRLEVEAAAGLQGGLPGGGAPAPAQQ